MPAKVGVLSTQSRLFAGSSRVLHLEMEATLDIDVENQRLR